ncbi:Zinc/iron permease [Gautieria morchelliformis]|nr:Zinc/iron permease [Gautieria morchelliformis]
MEGIWRVVTLSLVLGVSSFTVGILPLSFMFSAKRRLQLSTFGNGLLLGAALGVIIPEGIEAVLATGGSSLTSQIALSLLVGFAFMLILEQYFTPHVTSTTPSKPQPVFEMPPLAGDTMDYDQNRLDVETNPNLRASAEAGDKPRPPVQVIAYPLTLGLVIHSLADGLALGASASGESGSDTSLSLVVFIALIIHKSPTALALTSSLLSTSLPRSDIKKHVAVFSAATPVGTLVSFVLLNFIGAHAGNWTGVALLISGGTFLYVATVIQDIGSHSHDHGDSLPMEEMSKQQRVSLLVGGIFLPFVIGSLVGHGHDSGHVH